MDPGERRRATARTARLGFILVANVAALILLVRALVGAGSAEAEGSAEPPQAEGASLQAEPVVAQDALARPEPTQMLAADPGFDAALTGRVEALVMQAVAEAARRSKGRVDGNNTTIAVQVFDPREGRVLVRRLASAALIPASNMKLVTSAAALVSLGHDWHFETVFHGTAPPRGGVLAGDLVVRAGADPLYDPAADGLVEHLLEPAVRQLVAAGVREVRGDLVLDEGSFQAPGPGPGWPSASQHWQAHCALSAGFSANAGCLTALVRPRGIGAAAFSEVRPRSNGLERSGSVRTVKASARLDIAVGATSAHATLRGEIPASVPSWTSRFAHPDPVLLFEASLRRALERGGVSLAGGTRRQRGVPVDQELARLRTPLSSVLGPVNAESDNGVADQLYLALGAARGGAGTRAGGRQAVSEALERLGVSDQGLVQVDGSGLSREDRVTAEQLTGLLAAVLELEAAPRSAFLDSLAVSGTSGSLVGRMSGPELRGRVRAKTGWISGAGSLSGYVETSDGELLCFSILVQYPKVAGLNKHCWKPMQDDICAQLAAWRRADGRVR